MEVNNINNKDLVNNKIRTNKTGKSENVPESAEKETLPDGDEKSLSDKVSVDTSKYGNELQFAHRVFNKVKQSDIRNLTDIKAKIDQGAYNSEKVTKLVSEHINNALTSLETSAIQQQHSGTSETKENQLTQEDKERLLNDTTIQKHVSGRIIKDINSISKKD